MHIRKTERTQKTVAFLMNALTVIFMTLCFYYSWNSYYTHFVYYAFWGYVVYIALFAVSFAGFCYIYRGFDIGTSTTGDIIFSQLISVFFSDLILFFLIWVVTKGSVRLSAVWKYGVIQALIIIVLNYLFNRIYYSIFPPKKTLMIYEREDNSIYERVLKYQNDSYDIVKTEPYSTFMTHLNEVKDYECIIAVGLYPEQKNDLTKRCYERRKSIYIIPGIYDVIMNSGRSVYLVDTPVFKVNNFGPSQLEKIVKRIFDIFFALVMLVVTSPILLITAIAIKLQDGGPIFYKQVRLTQYGRPFEIIKFRSMKIDAEKDGVARLAAEHDDRITKVGNFIRSCRIDELPQLINILKGDMSVVGPRPERPELVEKIKEEVPEFDYRLGVKAGLTGYAQVYGKYNTKLKDKLLFDLIYIEQFSLFLDIRIMFMTFKILFKKESTEGV